MRVSVSQWIDRRQSLAGCTLNLILKQRESPVVSPFEEILEISSSFGRGRGYNERLDAAAVRLCKRRLECLINVHRFASFGMRDRGVAGPAEVVGVRQLNINVTFGVHGLANASGVIGDAAGSLEPVAHAASRTGSSLVTGRQIGPERCSCRKSRL